MPTLAPAAVLGGRYTAQRLLGERAGAQSWAGRDGASGTAVVMHVLPADNPQAPAVLDAARRTSGIDNPRLVRILDAGSDGGLVFFVEESLDGGQTLAALAGRGGLDAAEVRRLTGEAATALDAAQRRGLHHLFLTPESLIRLPDGSVKVAGLATAAALAGQDHIGGPRALRRDAQGLVALAYAGLTGRWPHGTDTGLQPAPRIFGGVPRPSEIAVGVPNDLDTICRQTLSEGLGPSSPGDYAAQIAPWPGPSGALLGPETGEIPAADSATEEAVATTVPRTALAGIREPAGAAEQHDATAGPVPDRQERGDRAAPAVPAPETSGDTEQTDGDTEQTDGDTGVAAADTGPAAAAGSSGATSAGAVAVAARARAAKALTARVGGLTKAATSRAGDALTERRSLKAAMRDEESRSRVGIDQTRVESGYEAPAPLLPAAAGAPPSRTQRRIVLALFAGVVAIAGFLGALGVAKIGSRTDIESILGGSSARPQPSASSTATSSAPGSSRVLGIVSASGYDPQGDQNESEDLAPRVYDEDPTTYWQTEGYQAPRFGGLKDGVGLILDMGQVVTPVKATLTLPTPSSVELYLGEDPSLTGAHKIGSVVNQQGVVSIDTGGQASGQYVIVWFTDAPITADGRYRATLAEIVLDG